MPFGISSYCGFPNVVTVHTSTQHNGNLYVIEVDYFHKVPVIMCDYLQYEVGRVA